MEARFEVSVNDNCAIKHVDDIEFCNRFIVIFPYFIRRVDFMMKRALEQMQKRSKFKLTFGESLVLDAVVGWGHLGAPVLCEMLHMEPPHVSRIITKLESDGLVTRSKTDFYKYRAALPKDERKAVRRSDLPHFTIHMTEQGHSARRVFHRALHAVAGDVAHAAPDSRRDRHAFMQVIEQLFDQLDIKTSAMSDLAGDMMRELYDKTMTEEEQNKLPILIEHVARPRPSGPVPL